MAGIVERLQGAARSVLPTIAALMLAMGSAIGQGDQKVTVVDADTVERAGIRYRLAGLDAPEIQHAKCQREREAGIRAAARLVALLAERPHELIETGRSGGFGRRLGRLTIAGENWAVISVREGHAAACAGRCQRKAHDWCAAK